MNFNYVAAIGATYGAAALLLNTDRARAIGVAPVWILLAVLLVQFVLELQMRERETESRSRSVVLALGRTLVTLLAALAIDQIFHATLRPLEANQVAVPALPLLSSIVLDLLGVEAKALSGVLLIQGRTGALEVALGFDKLALGPVLMMTAILVLRSRLRLSVRVVGVGVATLLAATVARQVFCCALLAQEAKLLNSGSGAKLASIYGSRWIDGATLLLLFILFVASARKWRSPESTSVAVSVDAHARSLRWALVAAVLLASSWAALHLELAGARKTGVVVFDDQHNGTWGRSDRRMDERWYGDYSTYNMNSALEWLGHHFPASVNRSHELSSEFLADASVLVLKTPSKPFHPDEIAAIHQWVEDGGSLLAIGDHTDLHGMNTHLNAILERYGIALNFDALSDAHSGSFNKYQTDWWYPEPAVLASLDRVEFMTGCSITTAGWPRGAMIGSRTARDPGDYTRGSNFGKRRSDPATGVGAALLAVGTTAGDGKVAVLSDQTIFSNYSLFKNGHDEFLMSVVNWLSRETEPLFTMILRVMAFFALVVGLSLASVSSPLLVLAFAAPLLVASNYALGAYHRHAFRPPTPTAGFRTAEVYWIGGACAFPPSIGSIGKTKRELAFDTLLTDIARTGVWPKVVRRYDQSLLPTTSIVFLVNPMWEPPREFATRLKHWVQDGGTLVVVDPEDSTWNDTSADTYLSLMGLEADDFDREDRDVWNPVRPGDGFATGASDFDWVRRESGSGVVLHAFGSEKLSRTGIGHSFTLPSKRIRERLQDLYSIVDAAAGREELGRHTYALVVASDDARSQ